MEIQNYESSQQLSLQIIDVTDQEMLFLRKLGSNRIHLQAQNWPKGVYFFQVREHNSGRLLGSGKLLRQ